MTQHILEGILTDFRMGSRWLNTQQSKQWQSPGFAALGLKFFSLSGQGLLDLGRPDCILSQRHQLFLHQHSAYTRYFLGLRFLREGGHVLF